MYLYLKMDIDPVKYNWNIAHNFKKQFDTFSNNNRFVFNSFIKMNKKEIILLSIMNNLDSSKLMIDSKLSRKSLNSFVGDFTLLDQDFKNDCVLISLECSDMHDIFKLYVTKKLKWYSFFFIFKYLEFDKADFLKSNTLAREKLKHTNKILKKFIHFNEDVFKAHIDIIQKKFNLQGE